MSLETLVNGYKAVDQAVLKQYTRLGQHIPEEKLYGVTTGLNGIGILGIFPALPNEPIIGESLAILVGIFTLSIPLATSVVVDLLGLGGEPLRRPETDSVRAVDSLKEIPFSIMKKVRLPYLAVGIGYIGMLCYDGIQDVVYDHFVPAMDYVKDSLGAIGFLSASSSMYLKDQDPKLLQKKPSRVKAFLNRMYERVKERLSPTPVPVPVPVAGYSVLEEAVD